MTEFDDVVAGTEDARRRLRELPGVRTVAIGSKVVAGELTGELSLQVLVAKKRPLEELPAEEVVPTEIVGLPTDVIEVGELYIRPAPNTRECRNEDTAKYRPLQGGVQVEALHGWTDVTTGTLGCFARTTDGKVVMLSNAHVLAEKDDHIGDRVGQPVMCSVCSACCSDPVGRVLRFRKTPHVDGAIATLDAGIQHAAQVKDIGAVAGERPITAQEAVAGTIKVQKHGRTTGHTLGTITGWVTDPTPIHDPSTGSVDRMAADFLFIRVREPSKCYGLGGDSGAVVLDEDRMVVALDFGGDLAGTYSFACPIQFVTEELDIEILTAANPVPVERRELTLPALAELTGAGPLVQTPGGRLAAELYERHAAEVRGIVRGNRRVAAVWRTHGGPELIHTLARAVEAPDTYRLPTHLEGRPFRDQVALICSVIGRHGSEELRSALEEHAPVLAAGGGATLAEAGDLLAAPDRISP